MGRVVLVALVLTQHRDPYPFPWSAPLDFGAPCSLDGGSLPLPGVCMFAPERFVSQHCVETLPGAGYRSTPELCNNHCRCPFGTTCLADSTMRFCIKVCYAPTDCRGDQVCHRFAQSTISACVSPSRESWLLPSDWTPDNRKYRTSSPTWREPPALTTTADYFRRFNGGLGLLTPQSPAAKEKRGRGR